MIIIFTDFMKKLVRSPDTGQDVFSHQIARILRIYFLQSKKFG